MARFAAVCALALLAVGCSGAGEGSNAVGEVVLEREDGVYMVDLASGEERRLGSVARFGGSWSPSGTKAAIDEGDTIVVPTIATGARERLVAPQCSLPVWAPDEKMLACEYNEPWIISTLDLVTGEGRTLTDPADVSTVPAWSPDSRSIAYLSYGLMVMGRDGSGKHRVARGGGDPDDGSPKWSPDGRRIAYLDENSVWVVNASGGDRRRLLENGGRATKQLAWSPDGRSIAVTHGDGDFEIFVVDVAGGDARNVTDNTGVNDERPTWSPDGRHIAYVSADEDGPGAFVVPVDGGTPSRVSDAVAILHWFPAAETG